MNTVRIKAQFLDGSVMEVTTANPKIVEWHQKILPPGVPVYMDGGGALEKLAGKRIRAYYRREINGVMNIFCEEDLDEANHE